MLKIKFSVEILNFASVGNFTSEKKNLSIVHGQVFYMDLKSDTTSRSAGSLGLVSCALGIVSIKCITCTSEIVKNRFLVHFP